MNSFGVIVGGMIGLLGTCAALDLVHIIATKEAAFEEARRLAHGRGIINLGAGQHRSFGAQRIAEQPEVLTNIDITPDGMPHFIQLDIEGEILPFADNQFGVALLSHVLEHLDNWQFALAEASRVADYVVIVLPHPAYFSGWLSPEHRQHLSVYDIGKIAELYPNVEVYY